MFFVYGSNILLKAAISILSFIHKSILDTDDLSIIFLLLGKIFKVFDQEIRQFLDVNVLAQTMNLRKYSFLTNTFVNKMRIKKRLLILKSLQKHNPNKNSRHKGSVTKYIKHLLLYNGTLDDPNPDIKEIEKKEVLKCDEEWPICLYDHTYKDRCISYFAYRTKGQDKFVDNYFDNPLKRDKEKEKHDTLLIERNRHYCTNLRFTTKLNKLLKESVHEAFPDDLLSESIIEEKSIPSIMNNYMKHIIEFDLSQTEEDKKVSIPTTVKIKKENNLRRRFKSFSESPTNLFDLYDKRINIMSSCFYDTQSKEMYCNFDN